MRLSCISPCYNMERYLKLFLEELPKQTIFNDIEIVLDHNEPSDLEIAWVKEFQQKYPGRLQHNIVTPVTPIGVSMNRCIELSKAPLLAIWNVDDLRTPDSLEKQVNVLNDKLNPSYGVCHGNFVITSKFGEKYGKLVDHYQYIDKHPELTRGMVIGPFFAWKKDLCNKVGFFDEQLKSGADFDLAIRLASSTKIGIVHGILGYYLDEGRGASTNGSWKQSVERTVIEVRYGITDKIQPQLLLHERFKDYDPMTIVNFGKMHCVREFFSDFDSFKKGNAK